MANLKILMQLVH